jgi:hypothetical protein
MMDMAAQVISAGQLALLLGIFFRLGNIVSTLKTHGERITTLEGKIA